MDNHLDLLNQLTMDNNVDALKSAYEILDEALTTYNSQVNDMSKFKLNNRELEVFINCMDEYKNQFTHPVDALQKAISWCDENLKYYEGIPIKSNCFAAMKQYLLSLQQPANNK